ncbi:MAG TPA: 4'-phosphopantetheinyl transferase superfamily protein [Epulopiscium sp.]|nr:4'-phosphopantetheinyl transferase superfamily protein [Candidatus Epulonipiscium sp.]
MTKVYIVDIKEFMSESNQSSKQAFLNKYTPAVSQQRQEKIKAFYFIDDKIRSLTAYLLLSSVLKKHYGVEGVLDFQVGYNGKPYLNDYKDIFFNISHCTNFVACIVGDQEVGIDIQDPFPFDLDIANLICSPEELETLVANSQVEKKRQLNRIWVLKEAYIKFTGQGMLAALKKIDFSTEEKQKRQDATLICIEKGSYYLGICF